MQTSSLVRIPPIQSLCNCNNPPPRVEALWCCFVVLYSRLNLVLFLKVVSRGMAFFCAGSSNDIKKHIKKGQDNFLMLHGRRRRRCGRTDGVRDRKEGGRREGGGEGTGTTILQWAYQKQWCGASCSSSSATVPYHKWQSCPWTCLCVLPYCEVTEMMVGDDYCLIGKG